MEVVENKVKWHISFNRKWHLFLKRLKEIFTEITNPALKFERINESNLQNKIEDWYYRKHKQIVDLIKKWKFRK